MSSPFEQAGRLRKVLALVTLLQAHRIPASRVEAMYYDEWVALAAKAGVKPPSMDTQVAVIDALARAEALRPVEIPKAIEAPKPKSLSRREANRAERDFRRAFTPNRHGEYA